jgi:hypothetical protein
LALRHFGAKLNGVAERLERGDMEREEALAKIETKWWIGKTAQEIINFQLYEKRLCMPFDLFHEALEKTLGRSVWTHEFADQKGLQDEYEGKRKPEVNPIESAQRICRKLGRDDLADNIIVIKSDK